MAEPIRTCIGCRRKAIKSEFVRLVQTKEGQVSVDVSKKSPGRGAYICLNPKCIKSALVPKRLNKVFKTNIDAQTIDDLKQALNRLQVDLPAAPAAQAGAQLKDSTAGTEKR